MTVTFCGHSQITNQKDVEEWLSDTLNSLLYLGATTFYLGGYVSFDILCATILRQKKYHPNIKLILVLPYLNTHKDLSLYDSTIYLPLESVPARYAIPHRNNWMIDHSDIVVAYVEHDWGCAASTLHYAQKNIE